MTRLEKHLCVALATLLLWTGALAQQSYVALGDSSASGVGAPLYNPSSGDCRRSDKAYAPRIAAQLPASLSFQACSGARVPDVQQQLATLSTSTSLVTVSVGGNDAGFVDIITKCDSPLSPSGCSLKNCNLDEARQYIREVLPG
jgi:lysophospholipase L1-like esterase